MIHLHFHNFSTPLEPSPESFLKYKKNMFEAQHKSEDFLWWTEIDTRLNNQTLEEIESACDTIKNHAQYFVIIGIGGSYLWSKALLNYISPAFQEEKIFFVGQNIDSDYTQQCLDFLKDKNYWIVCISKSGTTTEPAIAFRLFLNLLKSQSPDLYHKKVITITDKHKGALLKISQEEGFQTFYLDEDIWWRFSVLSAVGLIPICLWGGDIRSFVAGAKNYLSHSKNTPVCPSLLYAQARHRAFQDGKYIENLVVYQEKLKYISEWWKQLFWESEWKNKRWIFPASMVFSTDLHSLWQFIQDGNPILFQTTISLPEKDSLCVPMNAENIDWLGYLENVSLSYINSIAQKATIQAHNDAGVKNIIVECDDNSLFSIGELFMFFQIACALSAYHFWVNPFDQPWVEAYKNNMFRLLKKPGYF